MFDDKSRYAKTQQRHTTDRRGRKVTIVEIPEPPRQIIIGHHLMKQGQRVDHLAFKYLKNEAGFWRICEANDAMWPEALTEQPEMAIPQKTR